jgi:glycosyltransferase involved in cell wall biosynthesis
MKIAQIICTFPPYRGGMGNSVYHFARQAATAGHCVTVFTPLYAGKAVNFSRPGFDMSNFKVERLRPLMPFGNAAIIPQLMWRLKNFDLVHLHYPFYGAMLPVLIAKLIFNRKMKLLLHYHMDSIGTGLKGLIFKFNRLFVLPLLLTQADFISCASVDYVKNSNLTLLYQKHRSKFITVPFGVDLSVFKPLTAEKNQDGRDIFFVAALDKAHYFKGLDVLFRALKLIIDEQAQKSSGCIPNLKIAGEGELLGYYKQLASDLGVADHVLFLGGLTNEELAKQYNNARVFVLPSINQGEAFGLVLLEAMACGTPVVASNLPGVRSVFHNGIEGFAVTPGDEKELARKLWQILADDLLRKKMSEAALRLAIDKYDWDKIGADLVRFYYRANFTPTPSKGVWGHAPKS